MASITSVTLDFKEAASGYRKAVVVYYFDFTAEDVGKKFRVGISLWPEDPPRAGDLPIYNPYPLYQFRFGLLVQRDYFEVKPTAPGTIKGTKEASVALGVLNEDPGTDEIIPGTELPQPDQIFARVTLLPVGEELSKVSPTQTLWI
jgi:hypothetical protein